MNAYIKNTIVFALVVCLVACRKYIDDTPIQGSRVLEYTDDYRLLLNDRATLEGLYGHPPAFSSDDVDFTATELQNAVKLNFIYTQIYIWTKPFYDIEQDDYDWNYMYGALYRLNTVINGVMDSKGSTLEARQQIRAQAMVHRAIIYFTLVNLYGKQYDAATAATDPGIPVLVEPKLFVNLERASVKAVYDQVLKDLTTAMPFLPVTQNNTHNPAKAAGYALLSKVYLNMRAFTEAAAYADSALNIKNTLADYNDYVATPTYTFPTQYNDPEVLLRKTPRTVYGAIQLSNNLLNLLGDKDIRYKLFVRPGNKFYPQFTGYGFFPRNNYSGQYVDQSAVGLSVPDVWLTKAECLARAGDKDNAMLMVNELRKLRFAPADYADITATDAADALRLVIEERRREFFGRGMRWFDMRRLNLDAQFAQPFSRTFDGATYTLEPNSNGYIFPIAPKLILQNPEIEQNPK